MLLTLGLALAAPGDDVPSAASCPPSPPASVEADARFAAGRVVVVDKSAYTLGIYDRGALAGLRGAPACWPVAMAAGAWGGTKAQRGDLKTPEGWLRVVLHNPHSSYTLSLQLDYPRREDIDRGERAGIIDSSTATRLRAQVARGRLPEQGTALGGEIFVHGTPGGPGSNAWTLGCVALADDAIRLVYDAVPNGTWVLVLPGP
jgi:murein L,D-transpeptidase YafK